MNAADHVAVSDPPDTLTAMLVDLILPLECGGCGTPGTRWCAGCAHVVEAAADEPRLVTLRLDPGVPVFSLGRYAGLRRHAIVELKERGRADLAVPLAGAVRVALSRLIHWNVVGAPLTVVPAPTRRSAARRRGGDPVARIARLATTPGIGVASTLCMRAFTRDSVGLSAAARQRNVMGRIRLRRRVAGEVVLFDDVVTTGATACESVRVLRAAGADVAAVIAMAHA